jgi:hypothetical protein
MHERVPANSSASRPIITSGDNQTIQHYRPACKRIPIEGAVNGKVRGMGEKHLKTSRAESSAAAYFAMRTPISWLKTSYEIVCISIAYVDAAFIQTWTLDARAD